MKVAILDDYFDTLRTLACSQRERSRQERLKVTSGPARSCDEHARHWFIIEHAPRRGPSSAAGDREAMEVRADRGSASDGSSGIRTGRHAESRSRVEEANRSREVGHGIQHQGRLPHDVLLLADLSVFYRRTADREEW